MNISPEIGSKARVFISDQKTWREGVVCRFVNLPAWTLIGTLALIDCGPGSLIVAEHYADDLWIMRSLIERNDKALVDTSEHTKPFAGLPTIGRSFSDVDNE